jgi:adenylate cyclase
METERTILFADVCDSTGLTEALGNTASRRHIAELLGTLEAVVDAHRGVVIKTIGDEIMTAFDSAIDGIVSAVEMQRAISNLPPVRGLPTRIRVGLQHGPVLIEGGDAFGDVVNVAARIVGLSAADQVLTTMSTIEAAGEPDVTYRSLGVHGVKGRDAHLHLCEVLWRGETAQMTVMAPRLIDTLPSPELEVRLGDQAVSIKKDSGDEVTLGRGTECTVVVPSASASRSHAAIVCRGGRFYLEDHSTNGTYVRPEGGREVFVHRDQVLLQGSGLIRLGEAISVKGPLDIEYVTRYADDPAAAHATGSGGH